MPKQINNADAARELVEQFDLKGRVQLLLDETIVPVIIVGDLQSKAGGRRCGRNFASGAGGVGEFGFSGVIAAVGTRLRVESFTFSSGGSATQFFIRTLTSAELVVIGIATNRLFSFGDPDPGEVGSQVFNGTHTTATIGNPIGQVELPNDRTHFYPLDFTLFGGNTDVAGIAVFKNRSNSGLDNSVICTEFLD